MPATAKKPKVAVEIDQVELIEQEIKTLQIKKKQAIANKIAILEKEFLDSLKTEKVVYECSGGSYNLYITVEKDSPAAKLIANIDSTFRLSDELGIFQNRNGRLVISSRKCSAIIDFIHKFDIKPQVYNLKNDGHAQILRCIFAENRVTLLKCVDTE